MKGIMFQGTSSDVGKSIIATAICRILANKGYKVAPFKSQNMSNNSYVTEDGKEIGRAQAIQAEAAKVKANIYMNPILLKPQSEKISEIIHLGVPYESLSGINYRAHFYETGLQTIRYSLQKLAENFDYIVIEGAGSPVELNLNDRELVNMKVAELADVPVVLIADIDRGGVFASIYGTLALLSESERKRVKGIIINKFRGDIRLFASGVEWIEQNTGVKVLGVVPHISQLAIEGEDSLSMRQQFMKDKTKDGKLIDIAVIDLPYVENYTDLDPFRYEDDVHIRFVANIDELGMPDAIIIPSTKNILHDLNDLQDKGFVEKIRQFVSHGGWIIGLCGGYQMLSETIVNETSKISGLNLAPLITYLDDQKMTVQSTGRLASPIAGIAQEINGFQLQLGRTEYTNENVTPFLYVDGHEEGIYINNGQMIGTNFHHLFHNDEWRTYWLNQLRKKNGMKEQEVNDLQQRRDASFDKLANIVENALDIDYLIRCMNEWRKSHV